MAKPQNNKLRIHECALGEVDFENNHQREVEVTNGSMCRNHAEVAAPALGIVRKHNRLPFRPCQW